MKKVVVSINKSSTARHLKLLLKERNDKPGVATGDAICTEVGNQKTKRILGVIVNFG